MDRTINREASGDQLARRLPRRYSRLAFQEAVAGWLFASPWIIGFLVFTAVPMLFSLYASFTRYNIIAAPKWIGLRNYETIFFNDNFFWKALENTFWLVGFKVPIVMIVAIAIAMLLNLDLPGERFFRTIIYLPNVLSGVAAVFLWQWILAPDGLLNRGLALVGIDGPAWFVDPAWTKPGLIVMGMWWIGGNVLIYLAGLKGIPSQLYEAAAIDGANWWAKTRHITLPMLSPTIFFQIVTTIIGTFQIFTTVYIIAGSSAGGSGRDVAFGGPGQSLLFYVLYLYNRAFGKVGVGGLQMGYASALAWILFVIILVITLIQLRLAKRWVYYESE
ncbi:MAG: sugar ABC transporter permease [Chloroflexi bacterium]|nr:sugar ABC transporter permease [Chloroflexota bacterium]